jgi:hypothetical protein
MVAGILNYPDADETPLQIANMFSLPVATVRRVLTFSLTAQLRGLLDARLACTWSPESAYRLDKLTHHLGKIDKASRRSRRYLKPGCHATTLA